MGTISRRVVLTGAATVAAGLSVGVRPAAAVTPTNLPAGIYPRLEAYTNWSLGIQSAPLWTTRASSRDQLVRLANWAAREGWKLRPTGYRHNWSPTTIAGTENRDSRVLLVDTRSALTGIRITTGSNAQVRVGAGVSMDDLLATLSRYGLSLANHPAPGGITVGGALAIDGHGAALPAAGEARNRGHSFGTLSNLVMSIRAIVWDRRARAYVAREFDRTTTPAAVLSAHLGRAMITDVTLRAGRQQYLRCVSRTDIGVNELFAQPGTAARTLDSFIRQAGRAEVIWFPFMDRPWLKTWQPDPGVWGRPPAGSRRTDGPYNYTFADAPPEEFLQGVLDLRAHPERLPFLNAFILQSVESGLQSTGAGDIWGPAYHTMLYVRPTTLKYEAAGYAILTSRANVQKVVADSYDLYVQLLNAAAAAGKYPMNGPFEARVTGVDHPADVGIPGAQDPWLSAARRIPARPDLDCVVWVEALSGAGTPGAAEFWASLEAEYHARFSGADAVLRPEWSKGWAFTRDGAWRNSAALNDAIPASLSRGQRAGATFHDAVAQLDELDPYRVFSAPLLDQMLA